LDDNNKLYELRLAIRCWFRNFFNKNNREIVWAAKTKSSKRLNKLCKSLNSTTKICIAQNEYTEEETLLYLIEDSDIQVVQNILYNKNVTSKIFHILYQKTQKEQQNISDILLNMARNNKTPSEILSKMEEQSKSTLSCNPALLLLAIAKHPNSTLETLLNCWHRTSNKEVRTAVEFQLENLDKSRITALCEWHQRIVNKMIQKKLIH